MSCLWCADSSAIPGLAGSRKKAWIHSIQKLIGSHNSSKCKQRVVQLLQGDVAVSVSKLSTRATLIGRSK